jgi:C1A family cysteine protease
MVSSNSVKLIVLVTAISLSMCVYEIGKTHPMTLVMDSLLVKEDKMEAFRLWHHLHEKESEYKIDSEQGRLRFEEFKKNIEKVKEHNANPDKTHEETLTQWSDMSMEQYRKMVEKRSHPDPRNLKKFTVDLGSFYFIETEGKDVDWSPVNWTSYTGEIVNQKSCGGCWSITFSNAVEGNYNIKYKKSIALSRSDMIDCNPYGNGCDGGNAWQAAVYVNLNGLATSADYPFYPNQFECRTSVNRTKYITAMESPNTSYTKDTVKKMLNQGPLYIAFDSATVKDYKSGVIDISITCGYTTDHAVLLVGYGVDTTGLKYWLIKNSWGATWGETGYFRIAVKDNDTDKITNNNCHMNKFAARPVIA